MGRVEATHLQLYSWGSTYEHFHSLVALFKISTVSDLKVVDTILGCISRNIMFLYLQHVCISESTESCQLVVFFVWQLTCVNQHGWIKGQNAQYFILLLAAAGSCVLCGSCLCFAVRPMVLRLLLLCFPTVFAPLRLLLVCDLVRVVRLLLGSSPFVVVGLLVCCLVGFAPAFILLICVALAPPWLHPFCRCCLLLQWCYSSPMVGGNAVKSHPLDKDDCGNGFRVLPPPTWWKRKGHGL